MTEYPQPRFLFLNIILGLLATLGPLGQDMYIPSIPKIAADLGTSTNLVIFSVSSVLFGNAIGQMVHGPLMLVLLTQNWQVLTRRRSVHGRYWTTSMRFD